MTSVKWWIQDVLATRWAKLTASLLAALLLAGAGFAVWHATTDPTNPTSTVRSTTSRGVPVPAIKETDALVPAEVTGTSRTTCTRAADALTAAATNASVTAATAAATLTSYRNTCGQANAKQTMPLTGNVNRQAIVLVRTLAEHSKTNPRDARTCTASDKALTTATTTPPQKATPTNAAAVTRALAVTCHRTWAPVTQRAASWLGLYALPHSLDDLPTPTRATRR